MSRPFIATHQFAAIGRRADIAEADRTAGVNRAALASLAQNGQMLGGDFPPKLGLPAAESARARHSTTAARVFHPGNSVPRLGCRVRPDLQSSQTS
jgi:hypothetical protein